MDSKADKLSALINQVMCEGFCKPLGEDGTAVKWSSYPELADALKDRTPYPVSAQTINKWALGTVGKKKPPSLKHFIDGLEVLGEKREGGLSGKEKEVLTKLRTLYDEPAETVSIAPSTQQAVPPRTDEARVGKSPKANDATHGEETKSAREPENLGLFKAWKPVVVAVFVLIAFVLLIVVVRVWPHEQSTAQNTPGCLKTVVETNFEEPITFSQRGIEARLISVFRCPVTRQLTVNIELHSFSGRALLDNYAVLDTDKNPISWSGDAGGSAEFSQASLPVCSATLGGREPCRAVSFKLEDGDFKAIRLDFDIQDLAYSFPNKLEFSIAYYNGGAGATIADRFTLVLPKVN